MGDERIDLAHQLQRDFHDSIVGVYSGMTDEAVGADQASLIGV